jgi:hypothetical protein
MNIQMVHHPSQLKLVRDGSASPTAIDLGLGGAIAVQLRAGNPLLSHVLFGGYIGLEVWAGLLLRNGPTVVPVAQPSAVSRGLHVV